MGQNFPASFSAYSVLSSGSGSVIGAGEGAGVGLGTGMVDGQAQPSRNSTSSIEIANPRLFLMSIIIQFFSYWLHAQANL